MREASVESTSIAPAPSLIERQLCVMERILRNEPLPDVLATLCLMVEQEAQRPVRASILLVDESGARLVHGAAPSLPEHYNRAVDGLLIQPDRGTCLAAAARNVIVETPDFARCPGWEGIAHLPLGIGLAGAWSMPIRDTHGQVLGTFGTYFTEPRRPTDAERTLVETCVRTAAIAIERSHENDRRVARERRATFLGELSESTQPLTEAADIMRTAARLLADFLQADRCAYATVDDESVFVISGDHSRNGLDSIVGRWPVASFGVPCERAMRAGSTYIVTDAGHDDRLTPADIEAYRATRVAAVICVPLRKHGVFTAAMAVHQATPRLWTADEVDLVEEVVSRCWEALERARVARELQDSEARYRAMVEANPECVKLVSRDGTLLQMNAAGLRMLEATAADAPVGSSVYGFVAPEYRDTFREFNERVCAGEGGFLDFEIVGLRGTRRRVETTAVPLAHPTGGHAHLALTRDVTERHVADRALAESRARLDYAVRLSGIGFWYCDLPSYELNWDVRVKEHFWLEPGSQVTMETFYERIHPDDRLPTQRAVETAIAQRTRYDVHYRTVNPVTGAIKWIRARGGTAYAADGSPTRFDGVTVDVTAQKSVEEATRRLAARQALQLELSDRIRPLTSPDAIVAAASALLGPHLAAARVVYAEIDDDAGTVRPRYDWTRAGTASLVGRELPLDAFGPVLIGELRAGRSALNRDVTLDPRTAGNRELIAELGIRAELVIPLLRDGRLAVVLAIHSDTPRDWQDDDLEIAQEVAGRMWLALDVAQAQTALRAERDLSQSIFESMAEGFVLLDGDWTIRYVNEIGARLGNQARSAFLGRNLWELMPEFVGSELQAMYEHVRARQVPGSVEFLYQSAGGPPVWLEARAYPVPDGRLAVFFRDVSARKQAERAAQEASRRKDEFLAMLAHELRNPLAPIRAAATLLSMGRLDAPRIAQASSIISRQVGHMTGLVDDLLDVSRVTRGLVELERSEVKLTDVVSAAVEQVRPVIASRRHRLTLHLAPNAGRVLGDEKRLIQVLTNLLTNAAKYTPEGGDISIRVEGTGEEAELSVSDNGIGMSAELVERAFDLFTQAERTSDRTQGGLGIGLALVRSLVELHGGTVSAHSAGPGAGSEFRVRLPSLAGTSANARPATRPDAPAVLDGIAVLIVDDNEDAASTLSMCLEALGCRCIVEHDSRSALSRARSERPEVCILDIGLPEMDGNELARQLRADGASPDMLLIAVTGYGQERDRQAAIAAGFDHHVVKPPDLGVLAALIRQVKRPGVADGAGLETASTAG